MYRDTFVQTPQISLARSTLDRMYLVSLTGALAVLQSGLGDHFHSLFVALAGIGGALGTETLILLKRGRLRDLLGGSALATGLILSLFLPQGIHPLYAALGAAFAIVVVKQSFGGLGTNWLNPAAGGWLFLRLSWPALFLEPLGNLPGIGPSDLDTAVRNFLNTSFLSNAGIQVPPGLIDILIPSDPGMIASRGFLGLLLGCILITILGVNHFWVPAAFLGACGFLAHFLGGLNPLPVLLSGDVLAGAFLLASDPATGAKSIPGRLVMALAGGALVFLFKYPGGNPFGVVLAAACINTLLPLIRQFERTILYEKGPLSGRETL